MRPDTNIRTDLGKLKVMLENCDIVRDIIERCDNDEDMFLEDRVLQASAAFCLQRIGQLAKELSADLRTTYGGDEYWSIVIGTRDVMAHQYHKVSQPVQWRTLTCDIAPLRELLTRMIFDMEASGSR